MRKSLLTIFRSLFVTALIAGTIWSCEDEKPEIHLPAPVVPQPGFIYITSMSPDTIKFKTTDSIIFNLRTIPYNLLFREDVTVQVADTAGAKYAYADISSLSLRRDSIWNIVAHTKKGIRNGDIVSLMVANEDTVMYSEPMVLSIYSDHPWSIETLIPDTLSFTSGDTIALKIRTMPVDLLSRDSIRVSLADSTGNKYDYADVKSFSLKDNVWSIFAKTRKGVRTGDMVSIRISQFDTILYSDPIILSVTPATPRAVYALTPDTLSFDGDMAVIQLKTQPVDLLSRRDVSISITDREETAYKYAEVQSKTFKDSIWSISIHLIYGMNSGDVIKLKVADDDTVMYTKPFVLDKIAGPEPSHDAVDVVSGAVSAYLEGGQATMRLRTAPWNMFFKDSLYTLSLVDAQGNPMDGRLSIASNDFQPKDSCWNVRINILDQSLTDAFVSAKVICPDTVITTEQVNIKKVSITMRSIKVDNSILMGYDSITRTYSCRLDPKADLKAQSFSFDYDGDKITVGDSLLIKGQSHILDVSQPLTISVWKYDVHVDYILKLSYNYAVNILSGDISAFLEGGPATIKVRTAPWNVQFNDSTFILGLADRDGKPLGTGYEIAEKTFQRQDSSWTVKINVLEKGVTDAYVSAMMTCPDTVVYSNAVNIKKVSFSMKSVVMNDTVNLKLDKETNTFSTRVELNTDLSQMNLVFDHDGDKMTIGGKEYQKGQKYTMNLNKPITVSVWKYDIHIDYIVQMSYFYSIIIVSGPIAGFLYGGKANIRIKTEPWDVLLSGNGKSMDLVAEDGSSVESNFTIASNEFQTSDSCWSIVINVLDKNTTEGVIKAKLTLPDTVIYSKPVNLQRVTITMSSVKTGNDVKMNVTNNVFHLFRPNEIIDYTNQQFLFTHDGEKVTMGDRVLTEGEYNTINVSSPVTVSVWKYGTHRDFKIMLNTGLPIVRITSPKPISQYDRKNWVEGATMTVERPDGTINYEGTLALKGRGNGTWTETDKKPFAIRLDEKAKILGMHKQKRWILLASYKDRTLMRNDVAYWLSKHTEMPYTINGEFVELVWNGTHMGNYYLCEQARIDDDRIDIKNPNYDEPEKGGYFMEIDTYLDYNNNGQNGSDKIGDVGFWSKGGYVTNGKGRYNLPYIFKDPDEDETGVPITEDSKVFKYMQNYVKEMEDAIYAVRNDHNNHNWMNYLDIDRAVDFALIQEMMMNHDSYNTWPAAGPHSTFLYKDSCGPINFGPVWDFDYHTLTLYQDGIGNQGDENPRIRRWELLSMDYKQGSSGWGSSSSENKYYFADLAKNDAIFRALLESRWNEYKNTWKNDLPKYIDQTAEYIRISEYYNQKKWGSLNNTQNGDWNLSFQEAVNAIKTAFQKRWQFIDENLSKLPKDYN